ncbi:MAG: GNAT family N-acetyltransferase [Acidobacteria bacterium]|nr:GNAT family N-acetyltransferase [Acidobacteriota bacterium]MBI3661630.1 GNAT family N-acetyltransferase [Acidobacteriota bacterium]
MDAGIRPYKPEDFEALYRLDQQCYAPGIAYSRRTLKWYLDLEGADCLLAERDDAIAGFIVTARDGNLGHIITLDVAEAQRRRGIGTALLAEAEARMMESGVRRMSLETATDNLPAVAFWQRHGYRTDAVLKNYYSDTLDAYEMCKMLSAKAQPRQT